MTRWAASPFRLLRRAIPVDPWNNPASWPTWRQLLPHGLAAHQSAVTFDLASNEDVSWSPPWFPIGHAFLPEWAYRWTLFSDVRVLASVFLPPGTLDGTSRSIRVAT